MIASILSLVYRFGSDDLKRQLTSSSFVKDLLELLPILKDDSKENSFEVMTKKEDFYTWIDEDGNEHYVSDIESVPYGYRHQVKKISNQSMGGQLDFMSQKEQADMLNEMQDAPPPEQLKTSDHKIYIYTYEGDSYLNEATSYFDKYRMKYTLYDVVKNREYAVQLKLKLGLDINKVYDSINFPVIEINGVIIERIILETADDGKVVKTSLNTEKINKQFGLRSTFE